jgi:predicted helicase
MIDGNSTMAYESQLNEFLPLCVNLRGNARTQGEMRQKEAGIVFGSASHAH